MIERITLLCKLYDFHIRLRRHSLCVNSIGVSCKLLYDAGAYAHFRMLVKHGKLFLTAIRIRNIIAIHPSNQLVFTVLDAFIECISKSTVLCETNNIQYRTHLLLLCKNHSIQCIIQWTIAHQHKIIRQECLCLNALNCLLQILWLLFVIN